MNRNENVSGASLCLKKKMFEMLLLEKIPVMLTSPVLSPVSPVLPDLDLEEQQQDFDHLHNSAQWGGRIITGTIINYC